MARVSKNMLHSAAFHDLAVIDDDNVICHIGDDAQIVGNQQDGHAQFLLQVFQKIQNLNLDCNVQRGGRLIGNKQGRSADQRHCNDGTLAQAAR